jgi:OmpA-OmpF porin, OOP family
MIRLILLMVFFVSSCTTLEQAKMVQPTGSAFNQELTLLYLDFAENEARQYDWYDSQHFINKAMNTAYNHTVEPEILSDWRLPKEAIAELEKARSELMLVLANHDLVNKHYKEAAKAQFYFDCWVEQQEENWQIDDIAKCRNGFYQELSFLQKNITVAKPEIKHKIDIFKQSPIKEKKIVKSKNVAEKKSVNEDNKDKYKIRFAFDSSKIKSKAAEKIKIIAEEIKKNNIEEVVLNGYTDNVGTEEYNLKLSKKRSIAVRDSLMNLGIDPKKMVVFAYGYANNEVHTMPNVSEPKNRRVEVIISD